MSHSLRRAAALCLVLAVLFSLTSISFAAPGGNDKARAAARAYLQANSSRYQLKASLADLRDGRTVASLGGTHVHFQQTVNGVPVEGAALNVGLDRGNGVQLVVSGYKANLPQIDTTPRISADTALATARAATGATGALSSAPQTSLVVYAEGPVGLAWKITLSAEQPVGAWDVFVDAIGGQTLAVRSLLRQVEGTGRVFDPNPVATLQNPTLTDQDDADYADLASAYRTVALRDLDGSGYLRGPFVDASSKEPARESSFVFNYGRDDARFEQVMAYYHIDRTQRYIQSLGFTNVNNRQQPVKVSTFSYDNSYYNPPNGTISLGRGGVDDAEDADVIVHEYGHSVQDNQVPGFGSTLEGGAMGEGFSDYLAFTMSAEGQSGPYLACVAEWDATSYSRLSPPCLRRIDKNKHYPEDVVGRVHADGEIWSRALFDLWNTLGRTTADRLVLQSHFYLTPTASFEDGANAILAADRALNHGANQAKIRKIFADRGIPTN
ncbi:MAG TPA: M36 family metallopeptidase [Herpetosiphonaceae bacterium]